MKKLKKKIFIGALAASGALTFTACSNHPESVYGPPEYFETETAAQQTSEDRETVSASQTETSETAEQKSSSAAGFDVTGNIPEDVYGPPSYWEEDETVENVEETAEGTVSAEKETQPKTKPQISAVSVEDNIPVCVYGPPEYFEK